MGKRREKRLAYMMLCLVALVFLIPLCWVILASLDANANIAAKVPAFTLNNYKEVLTSSRYEMKHKRIFMLSMLFMTCLPITTIMVPVYRLFVMVKLYDNIWGVVLFLTASNLPYAIWMMKNFMDSVPVSLEEAAWIDGASRLKALFRVVFPLMFAGVSSVGIYVFSGCWGNFQVPFILFITAEKMPASVTLYRFFGNHNISYGSLAAFSLVYAMPSILLYVISQRYMSKGFSMEGGTK